MEVRRTHNAAFIAGIVGDEKLWTLINEDGDSLDPATIETEHSIWLGLIDGQQNVRGFVIVIPKGRTEAELHVAIRPEYWGDSETNVALGKLAVADAIARTGARKLTAQIPTTDHQVVRYAQRVGFQREGVNKKSYLRGGELLDQYHMGYIVE